MKKIISFIIAVLMLCALCVTASAEVEVPGDFLDKVLTLANETPHSEFGPRIIILIDTTMRNEGLEPLEDIAAFTSYFEAGGDHLRLHDQSYCAFAMYYYACIYSNLYTQASENASILLGKLIDCAGSAVSQLREEGELTIAAGVYDKLGYLHSMYLADQTIAEKYFMAEVEILLEAAEKALTDGDLVLAINMYEIAAATYQNGLGDEGSAAEYQAKADGLRAESDSPTGSTLSEGSLTIVVGITAFAVGFLAAMFIFKKKKPALANGESEE